MQLLMIFTYLKGLTELNTKLNFMGKDNWNTTYNPIIATDEWRQISSNFTNFIKNKIENFDFELLFSEPETMSREIENIINKISYPKIPFSYSSKKCKCITDCTLKSNSDDAWCFVDKNQCKDSIKGWRGNYIKCNPFAKLSDEDYN